MENERKDREHPDDRNEFHRFEEGLKRVFTVPKGEIDRPRNAPKLKHT